jgi:hypothetical protein
MIIFVGDKPSPRMKPGAKPFQGAVCNARLYDWIKSVLPSPYESAPKWGYPAFKVINSSSVREYFETHHFVALGNNASRALGSIPHFKLPHPSGRNRQINDTAFINEKLKKCREWLKKVQASAEESI